MQYNKAYCNALLWWNYVNVIIKLQQITDVALNNAYDAVANFLEEFAGKQDFLAILDASKKDIEKYIVDLKLNEYFKSLTYDDKNKKIDLLSKAVYSKNVEKNNDDIKLEVKTKMIQHDKFCLKNYQVSINNCKISDINGLSEDKNSFQIDNILLIHLPNMLDYELEYKYMQVDKLNKIK